MNPQEFLSGRELQAETVARFAYLLASVGVTVVLWHASRLEIRLKHAAAAAGLIHFFVSFTADLLLVCHGQYSYKLKGLLLCVPVDLHLAWAALWGTGYCLVWQRLNGWKRPVFYVAVVLGTFAWDLAIVSYSGAIIDTGIFGEVNRAAGTAHIEKWWKWDLALLAGLPWIVVGWCWLVTEARGLWLRAGVYALGYAFCFYVLIPGLIRQFGDHVKVDPTFPWPPGPLGSPLALVALGSLTLLGAWAAWALYAKGEGTPLPFDPTRKLVTSGPYAFVRNPMQLSGVGVAIVYAIALRSGYLGFYAFDLLLLLCFANAWEQTHLARTLGEPYARYAAQVRNWLPRLRPYRDG